MFEASGNISFLSENTTLALLPGATGTLHIFAGRGLTSVLIASSFLLFEPTTFELEPATAAA